MTKGDGQLDDDVLSVSERGWATDGAFWFIQIYLCGDFRKACRVSTFFKVSLFIVRRRGPYTNSEYPFLVLRTIILKMSYLTCLLIIQLTIRVKPGSNVVERSCAFQQKSYIMSFRRLTKRNLCRKNNWVFLWKWLSTILCNILVSILYLYLF